MPNFKEVEIPDGDLLQTRDGKLVVGDRPIIGYLRGDGIGLDITPVMQRTVEQAVLKAYGDKRKIVWCPLYFGLEGLHRYGVVFPDEGIEAIKYLKVAIKGPFTTPIGEETHVCLHCAHQQYHPGRARSAARTTASASASAPSTSASASTWTSTPACAPSATSRACRRRTSTPTRSTSSSSARTPRTCTPATTSKRGSDMAKAIIALIKEKTGREIRPDSGIGVKPISRLARSASCARRCSGP